MNRSKTKSDTVAPNGILMGSAKQWFSCVKCGKCCSIWDVPVTVAERRQIETFDFPSMSIPKDKWFQKRKGFKGFYVAKHALRCVFLDETNTCRIHAAHGELAKPLACRLYPFTIFPLEDSRLTVSLRHDCPQVAAGKGRNITEYVQDIKQLAKSLKRPNAPEQGIYAPNLTVRNEQLRMIRNAYSKFILHSAFKPETRFYAAARLLEFHEEPKNQRDILNSDSSFATDAFEFVKRSIPDLEMAMDYMSPLNCNQRIRLRYYLSGFARVDEEVVSPFIPVNRFSRMKAVLAFTLGTGNLKDLGEQYPDTAGIDPVEAIKDRTVSKEADQVYFRYIATKLDAAHFYGRSTFRFPFTHGMRHLLLTFPVARLFAGLFARVDNRNIVEADDMINAIMLIDRPFAHSPFFNLRHIKRFVRVFCSNRVFPAILNLTKNNAG